MGKAVLLQQNLERKFLSLLMARRPDGDGDRPPYHYRH